jgi:hypothetical protein
VCNPHQLISWWDMNKFSAGLFVNIGASLQWLVGQVETGKWDESTREAGERFGTGVAEDLRKIGCDVSAQAAIRFGSELPNKFRTRPITDLKPRAEELQSVIFDEMNKQLFLWVPPGRARYYEYPEDKSKWDEAEKAIEGRIRDRFGKASTEINLARECYALARWTPCVFHLMRACEIGIKALYKSLGQPPPSLASSWGKMIEPMDKQLALKVSQRHGDWATNPDFFYHATNDIRAIKLAWRDKTMHVESDYNEREARKALNAVTSFFEHLSTKLDQDGKFYP